MTKLLEQAVEAVRRLPSNSQDEIAQAMLQWAQDEAEPEPVEGAHLSAVLEGLAQAKQENYASAAEVKAAFSRFG